MDEINEFFKFNTKFVRIPVTGGTTGGRVVTQFAAKKEVKRDFDKTTDYAEEHMTALRKRLLETFKKRRLEDDTHDNRNDYLYNHYDFIYRKQIAKLPIADSRKSILYAIQMNTVVVLQGSTGCGKTTQVPQYILDEAFAKEQYCNIIVAQPRRIAASSNAKRVCNERGWKVGTVVGYQVGSDQQANCGDDTRILYCTTGVLLEKIIGKKSLSPYTHIILDEVHERNKEMDFLLIVIYKLLNPNIKVVLMSATIDAEQFADYFRFPRQNQMVLAPIINIDRQSNFSIKKYYLDDLEIADQNYENTIKLDINKPRIDDDVYTWAIRLIILFERMDRRDSRAAGISDEEYQAKMKPTVLVFLPGIYEINVMFRYLEAWKQLNETKIVRIVMHSTVSSLQAELAMQTTDTNIRKIILATNIAESSITVPDVKYVIDFCLTRNLETDSSTNFTSLRLAWSSKNNCEQRAGRTGRVMDGKCYRLVTKEFYNTKMRSSAIPEIVNSPLENIILKAKILEMGSPESILALAIDKPKLSDIGNAILRLKEMGALLPTSNGLLKDFDGDITFIGRIMSCLPLDCKLSKLIIFGYCFSVLHECIVIAAALNCTKNMFTYFGNEGVKGYSLLLEWSNGSGSDLFALLNAYNAWSHLHQNGKFGNNNTNEERDKMLRRQKNWAEKYGLELVALYECQQYVKDLYVRLNRLNLKPLSKGKFQWSDNEKNIILKVVISGAFYPNFFMRSTSNRRQSEREHFEVIGGRDPCNTVYFTGFEQKYLRNIYTTSIKDLFIKHKVTDDPKKIKVAFDVGSQKVFVTFRTDGKIDDQKEYGVACQPGFVITEVYKAIKMRNLRLPTKICVIEDTERAHQFARRSGLYIDRATYRVVDTNQNNDRYAQICTPRVLDQTVVGFITHVDSCNCFWFQPKSESNLIKKFSDEINHVNSDLKRFHEPTSVKVGAIIAAPFYVDDPRKKEYFRAKVLSICETSHANGEVEFKVFFIDFGNTEDCKFSELRRFTGVSAQFISIPPRCFRCALVGVQPSLLNAPNGLWSSEANSLFRDLTDGLEFEADVYSVVDGVVRVNLKINNDDLGQMLIQRGFGERSEENYMSKCDNLSRQQIQKYQNGENYLSSNVKDYLIEDEIPEINPPHKADKADKMISLRGPISPLEISIFPVANSSNLKNVKIDQSSVNSVMLENEPNDMSDKYLVSSSVCQMGNDNNDLSVRQTTLLPHIRGFAPLMAAIFCPTMELKRDEFNNHFVAMITGLGYDENEKRPIFAENDMTFHLDTEFTIDDFKIINKIRFSINSLFFTKQNQKLAINFDDSTKFEIIMNIKDLIIQLLKKPRLMLKQHFERAEWNEYPKEDVISTAGSDVYGQRSIFPSHNLLKLHPKSGTDLLTLQTHVQKLHDLSLMDESYSRNIVCKLCNDDTIKNAMDLRLHLISRLHLDRALKMKTTLNEIYN